MRHLLLLSVPVSTFRSIESRQLGMASHLADVGAGIFAARYPPTAHCLYAALCGGKNAAPTKS